MFSPGDELNGTRLAHFLQTKAPETVQAVQVLLHRLADMVSGECFWNSALQPFSAAGTAQPSTKQFLLAVKADFQWVFFTSQ